MASCFSSGVAIKGAQLQKKKGPYAKVRVPSNPDLSAFG